MIQISINMPSFKIQFQQAALSILLIRRHVSLKTYQTRMSVCAHIHQGQTIKGYVPDSSRFNIKIHMLKIERNWQTCQKKADLVMIQRDNKKVLDLSFWLDWHKNLIGLPHPCAKSAPDWFCTSCVILLWHSVKQTNKQKEWKHNLHVRVNKKDLWRSISVYVVDIM